MVHEVNIVAITGHILELNVDGVTHKIDLSKETQCLANASYDELSHILVSPSGYGLHWPLLDEDLSVDGLIGKKHLPPSAVHGVHA